MSFSKPHFIRELKLSQEYFNRSTRSLDESDSEFAPTPEQMTVAQQVAHVAHTIDWFIDGAFSPNGFDLDFSKHTEATNAVTSLKEARILLERSYAKLIDRLEATSDNEWTEQIAPGPVMGGDPRWSILTGVLEHTAHHRGALTVYARLRGKVPPMPYMD